MGIVHSKNYSITKKLFNKIFIQKIWKLFIQKNYSFFWKIDYRPGLGNGGGHEDAGRVDGRGDAIMKNWEVERKGGRGHGGHDGAMEVGFMVDVKVIHLYHLYY